MKRAKVLILGATGMLGNSVGKYFHDNHDYDVYFTTRDLKLSYGHRGVWIKFDPLHDDLKCLPNVDYIINCIGIIKPFMLNNLRDSIFINSVFPHDIASFADRTGARLIHITTDCVFSGRDGLYSESSQHDDLDYYGRSKSLGEPKNCMVLRTSIIGEEIHKNASLVSWVKSQSGGSISGYTNHLWNGITTKQYASVCDKIISQDLFQKDLFHIYSDIVSKYELVSMINDRFNLGISINAVQTETAINRTLSSIKPLCTSLQIPTVAQQIQEL